MIWSQRIPEAWAKGCQSDALKRPAPRAKRRLPDAIDVGEATVGRYGAALGFDAAEDGAGAAVGCEAGAGGLGRGAGLVVVLVAWAVRLRSSSAATRAPIPRIRPRRWGCMRKV